MNSKSNPAMLSFDDVAKRLNISRSTLINMINAGRFAPSIIRLSRHPRVRAAELDDWILAQCPPSEEWSWEAGK